MRKEKKTHMAQDKCMRRKMGETETEVERTNIERDMETNREIKTEGLKTVIGRKRRNINKDTSRWRKRERG